MENPLVSIALCTYNGEQFLEEQLLSIINQTYKNIEIVISDDASVDSTLKIIEKYSFNHPNIKVIKNSENLGYLKNFENAIAKCSGKYVFLSDQDDIWAAEKVMDVIGNFKEGTFLVFHDSEFISSSDIILKKMSERFSLNQKITPLSFLIFNGISGHALAFDSAILNDVLPFPKIVHHDCWISFIAACKGNIKYLPNTLVKYRQHEKSETDLLKIKSRKIDSVSSSNKNALLIERTKHFAQISFNPYQDKFLQFKKLLIKRQELYFSFNLFSFVLKYHQSIFSFKRKKGLMRIFYTLPYIWGIKIKTFFYKFLKIKMYDLVTNDIKKKT